jgi:hypothetical protein
MIDNDELVARRIAAEEAQYAVKNPRSPNAFTPTTSHLSVSTDGSGSNFSDVEFAHRLQQELEDERIAREIANREQEQISHRQARQWAPTPPPPRRRGCLSTCCGCFIPLFLVLAAAGAVVYWYGIAGKQTPNWIPSPQDFSNEDPFNALKPSDADRWRTSGPGLTLELLNALDERWYPYFDLAVSRCTHLIDIASLSRS